MYTSEKFVKERIYATEGGSGTRSWRAWSRRGRFPSSPDQRSCPQALAVVLQHLLSEQLALKVHEHEVWRSCSYSQRKL